MLDFENLRVLTIRAEVLKRIGWRPDKALFFAAETCARYMYVFREADTASIPEAIKAHASTKIYGGKDAYEFLLKFYCGLMSHKRSEQHVTNQLISAWNSFVGEYPESRYLKPFMDALFHDGGLVRSAILTPHISHASIVRSAVRMADVTPQSSVVLLGGKLAITRETILALVENPNRKPQTITIAFPRQGDQIALMHALSQQRNACEIAQVVKTAPLYSTVSEGLAKADATFVCQAMAGGEEATRDAIAFDQQICNAWEDRSTQEPGHKAKLFHLTGYPQEKGESVGPWITLGEKTIGFVPFREVRAQFHERIEFVRAVIHKSEEAISNLVQFRVNGDQAKTLEFDLETMGLNFRLMKRQLGYDPRLVTAKF